MRSMMILLMSVIVVHLWAIPSKAQEVDTLDLWIEDIEVTCEGDSLIIVPYIGLAAFGQVLDFESLLDFELDGTFVGSNTFLRPAVTRPSPCNLWPPPCNRECYPDTTYWGEIVPGECWGITYQGSTNCACVYVHMGPALIYVTDGKSGEWQECTVTIDVNNQIVEVNEDNNSTTIDVGGASSAEVSSWTTIKTLYR